jgi:O-antigen/teichoic acid export membrane protein
MADQAASSLSNVLVAILVARSVGAESFGAFGLATVVYGLVLGLVRALVGEPFLGRHSSDPPEVRRDLVPELVGVTLTIALLGSLAVALVGLGVSGLAGSALTALALILPVVMVQDTLRFVFVVDRAAAALAIDLVWLVLVATLIPLIPADAGVGWYVGAWGAAGGVAAVVGLALSGPAVHAVHPSRWLRRSWRDGSRYVGDFVTAQASTQAAVIALGAVSGLATLGAVRASQVYFGPLNTIHSGVYLAVVPEGTKLRSDRRRLERLIAATSVGLALVAAAWTVVGVALPDSVGRALFDRSWPGADELMVPMGVSMIAGGIMSGGFLGVRSLGNAQASLRSRLLSAPGQLVLPLVGAALGGAVGFALGAAAGRLLASGIWWMAFYRVLASGGPAHLLGPEDRPPPELAMALSAGAIDGD